MKPQTIKGKVALVTGASRGIGRAIAKRLAKDGAQVIAIARKTADLEELDDEITKEFNTKITLVPMDLRDYKALDLLAEKIYQRWKSLDILIGNAAILGMLAPVGHITPAVFADTIAVNLMANYRLLYTFDQLLNKSQNRGHAIFISSSAAKRNQPYWSAYASSKAALEALALTYANENKQKNICVQIFVPGPVNTRMYQKAYPGKILDNITKPHQIADAITDILKKHHDKTACIFDYVNRSFIRTNV